MEIQSDLDIFCVNLWHVLQNVTSPVTDYYVHIQQNYQMQNCMEAS